MACALTSQTSTAIDYMCPLSFYGQQLMFNMSSALNQYSWLENYAPGFQMQGSDVKVLSDPSHFYDILKSRARNAKKRIIIASLYLGTGLLENQLVDAVQNALADNGNELKVKILLDFARGSRGEVNSLTALLPLVSGHPEAVQVGLYHTPDLRGILRLLLPGRCNEIVGLAHMKIYVIDSTAIVSGANLSHDYFTDRQDRYVVLENPKIADFFEELVDTVSSFSFRLAGDGTVALSPECHVHPYLGNRQEFAGNAKKRVEDLLARWRCKNDGPQDGDTRVYPLIQMGPLGVTRDSDATSKFLRTASMGCQVHLATGYFNLTENYQRRVLRATGAKFNILVAHPRANGFFGTRDLSRFVPHVYTYLVNLFFQKTDQRIKILEYERPGWTFHAKGLWCCLPGEVSPSLTFIGSPNFGYRSVYKDLEAQLAIVTENEGLRSQLLKERDSLFERATVVSGETFRRPERRVPFLARIVAKITRHFF